MTIEVRTHLHDQAVVIELDGVANPEVLALIADGIAQVAAAGPCVIVDLERLALTRLDAVFGFLGRLSAVTDQVGLASARLSTWRILRRAGGPDLAVFPDLASALAWAQPATGMAS